MAPVVRVSWASLFVVSLFTTLTHSQSSNQCTDKDVLCKVLAARGHCSFTPKEMATLCPVSCNLCKVPRRTIANPDFVRGLPIIPERVPSPHRRSTFPNDNRRQKIHHGLLLPSATLTADAVAVLPAEGAEGPDMLNLSMASDRSPPHRPPLATQPA